MDFHTKYLPKADTVFTVMFLNTELCEKTLQAVLEEPIELKDIVAEYKNDLHKAALSSIFFDIKTQTKDGRIITLDLQRKYSKDRIRNRTVYYACREISSQKVVKSQYENLKNVVVTFLLTEASLKNTADNSKIQLYNDVTRELYSELLTIHEINIKHISNKNSLEMQTLRTFFEISNDKDYEYFVKKYGKTNYGALLLENYHSAVRNPSLLDTLEKEDKFMFRLSEEERLEEHSLGKIEGRKEGKLEAAEKMLKKGFPIEDIMEITGLTLEEIKSIS